MQPDPWNRNCRSFAVTIVSLCLFTLFGVAPSVAGERVVHAFAGGEDGMLPAGGLIADQNGNLYGTTEEGGNGCFGGCGTVFKIRRGGSESVLYAFKGGRDGQEPVGRLFLGGTGNLYGTTESGGGNGCSAGFGCGAVFTLSKGKETVLYRFQGQGDGSTPLGGVVADANGDLFGTTGDGGNFSSNCAHNGCGTVFELQPNGNLITLYAFQGDSDGGNPVGGVIMDTAGNLYGTAQGGAGTNCADAGCGVVFEIPAGGTYTLLYTFQGGSDGDSPQSGLIADGSGNLYGTTVAGGDSNCGNIFEVPAGGGSDKVLYGFRNGSDGANPYAGVVMDSQGNLYGTTQEGGGKGTGCRKILFGDGCGTVFKLTPAGDETVLVHFYRKHGQLPEAPLLLGNDGALYGTTTTGGAQSDGVVFKVTQ